jgi:cytochrome c biogenesis protein CcmG/thiol:disulfide interchange protein DsbE
MKNRDMHKKDRELDLGNWIDERLAARLPDPGWQPDATRGIARLLEQRDARPRGRRWTWVAAGALATSLSLAAFPATRMFAQRCVSACVGQSNTVRHFFVANSASLAGSTVFKKPAQRTMAPDFVLNDTSGEPVRLSELRGKVVLLNFWATWCSPCQAEIPLLMEFQQTYRNRDFVVLGVSLDDSWNPVKRYMDEKKMNYRVVISNTDVTHLYGGLEAIPTTLIIDKSGRIAATHLGLCSRREYETDIQAVLNE